MDYSFDIVFFCRGKQDGWNDTSLHNFNLYYLDEVSLINKIKLLITLSKVKFYYVFTTHTLVTGLVGLLVGFSLIKKKYFIGRESTSIYKRFKGVRLFKYQIHYYLGYRKLDLLICQTKTMKRELVVNKPWLFRNSKVIPNPVDIESSIRFSSYSSPIHINRPYIVAAGRLIKLKGFDMLIQAFYNIKKEHSNLNLIILGEGPERNNLVSLIRDLKLNSSVVLEGFVENVYPYFKNAITCVVSSKVEGFPNVLLQMMSVNSNVVSTNCAGGISQINGLIVVDKIDVSGLQHGILSALNSVGSKKTNQFSAYLQKRSTANFYNKIEEHFKA